MTHAIKAAEQAALKYGCKVVYPQLPDDTPGTDFNDLHQKIGLDEVKRQIEENCYRPGPEFSRIKEPRTELKHVPQAKEGELVGTQPGREYNTLAQNRQGTIANLDNVVRVLEHGEEWKNKISFDGFRQRILSTWSANQQNTGNSREWTDNDDKAAALWFQRNIDGLAKIHTAIVREAVQVVAFSNRRDECREYMESRKWDGIPRIDRLFPRGFSAEESLYTSTVSRKFMVSIASRGMSTEGSKVDTAPIFRGPQGCGKSTGLEALAGPGWFAEVHTEIGSKDFVLGLQGKLINEFSEMHSLTKAETGRVKAAMSCRVDRIRTPYGTYAQDLPRRGVFAGTTNRDDWNKDETGARRFWPIECLGKVDVDWIRKNRNQLFAEAVAAYKAGETWWIDDEKVNVLAKIEQEKRFEVDVWEEPIQDYLDCKTSVKMPDILKTVLKLETDRQGQREQWRVGKILRSLGWESTTTRVNKKVLRVWRPVKTEM